MKLGRVWWEYPNEFAAEFHAWRSLSKELYERAVMDGSIINITLHVLEGVKLTVQDHIDQLKKEGFDAEK